MDLSLIFTVPDNAGLFRLISRSKNSAIVESLVNGKRLPIFNLERVSALADISIYTNDGEISLPEVFRKIYQKQNQGEAPSHKESGATVRAFFLEVLPDFDQERVYDSNIKKVLQWYNLLLKNNLVDMELSEREKKQQEAEVAETSAE